MTVITMSRQFASRAEEVATQLCSKLGLRAFDKMLIARVAAEVGLAETQVVDYSEENYKLRTFFEALFVRPRPVAEVTTRVRSSTGPDSYDSISIDETRAVDLVRAAIKSAYERGDVLIIGRAGQVVLQDKRDVLHVRIVAPLEARIAHLQQTEQLTMAQSRGWIAERDRASAEYLRMFYHVDVDDPSLYHLVLNTGALGIDRCADLISQTAQTLTSQPQTRAA